MKDRHNSSHKKNKNDSFLQNDARELQYLRVLVCNSSHFTNWGVLRQHCFWEASCVEQGDSVIWRVCYLLVQVPMKKLQTLGADKDPR